MPIHHSSRRGSSTKRGRLYFPVRLVNHAQRVLTSLDVTLIRRLCGIDREIRCVRRSAVKTALEAARDDSSGAARIMLSSRHWGITRAAFWLNPNVTRPLFRIFERGSREEVRRNVIVLFQVSLLRKIDVYRTGSHASIVSCPRNNARHACTLP